MCRNIKTLANFEPPNEAAFNRAVNDVTMIARRLIDALTIKAPPRNREEEAHKARERAAKRFG